MRIGFDAKRFFENRTGLGSYSRTLINALVSDYPQHEYFLYTPTKPSLEHISKKLDISKIKIRYPKKSNKNYWRTRGILTDLAKDQIDIYHGLSNELPYGIHKTSIKTVVTIHDLLYKDFPEDYPLIDRMVFDWKSRYACSAADSIVAISEKTKDSIVKNFDIEQQKIQVIYQDVDPIFHASVSQAKTESILNSLSIDYRFIIFIGNFKKRKNLKTVVEALAKSDESLHLVAIVPEVGIDRLHSKLISTLNLTHRIHFFSNLDIEEINVLYRSSVCLVYPSLGEGWGLPVEEAMATNSYTIVPNKLPFIEVSSKLKLFLDNPVNPVELAAKIEIANQEESIVNNKFSSKSDNSIKIIQLIEDLLTI